MRNEHETKLPDIGKDPIVWFATTEDGRPRVRPMSLWFFDRDGFYFHTGKQKNIFRQISENPLAEFALYTMKGEILRIDGGVEILDDPFLMNRLLTERPWVFDSGTGGDLKEEIAIFRVVRMK